MKKQIIMAAVVAVALGMAGSASAQFGGLGNALKNKAQTAVDKATDKAVNKATDTATGAAAKVALDVKTTCQCNNGSVDAACQNALGGELVGKLQALEAIGQEGGKWFYCDIHGKTLKQARQCSEQLLNAWVKMGAKRLKNEPNEGDTKVACRVHVSQ